MHVTVLIPALLTLLQGLNSTDKSFFAAVRPHKCPVLPPVLPPVKANDALGKPASLAVQRVTAGWDFAES